MDIYALPIADTCFVDTVSHVTLCYTFAIVATLGKIICGQLQIEMFTCVNVADFLSWQWELLIRLDVQSFSLRIGSAVWELTVVAFQRFSIMWPIIFLTISKGPYAEPVPTRIIISRSPQNNGSNGCDKGNHLSWMFRTENDFASAAISASLLIFQPTKMSIILVCSLPLVNIWYFSLDLTSKA